MAPDGVCMTISYSPPTRGSSFTSERIVSKGRIQRVSFAGSSQASKSSAAGAAISRLTLTVGTWAIAFIWASFAWFSGR